MCFWSTQSQGELHALPWKSSWGSSSCGNRQGQKQGCDQLANFGWCVQGHPSFHELVCASSIWGGFRQRVAHLQMYLAHLDTFSHLDACWNASVTLGGLLLAQAVQEKDTAEDAAAAAESLDPFSTSSTAALPSSSIGPEPPPKVSVVSPKPALNEQRRG